MAETVGDKLADILLTMGAGKMLESLL